MSLQLATNELKLYVSTPAMRFLNDNVDEFAAYRLPKQTAANSSSARSSSKAKPVRRIFSGCWLCPAADHQAWDARHHPRKEDGSRMPVSKEDKAAILKRVADTPGATEAQKSKECADIKEYWKQYSL